MKKPIIIAVIIIALLVGVLIFIDVGQFATTSGVSVLSVTKPNIVSVDDDLSELNWLVLTKLGGADKIQFTMYPSDFKQKSGGTETLKPFTATVDSIDDTVEYKIFRHNDFYFQRYHVSEIRDVDLPCPANTVLDVRFDRYVLGDLHFCIVEEFIGKYGTLSNPTVKFKADLSVSNGIQTLPVEYEESLSSTNPSVAFLDSDNEAVVIASWQGNLVTGNPEPEVPEIAVLVDTVGDKWGFISESKFDSYKNAQEDYLRDFLVKYNAGWSTRTQFENLQAFAAGQSSQLDSLRFMTIDNHERLHNDLSLINPTSESEAKLIFDPEVKLQSPVVTWWIRADWLGIKRQVGDPDIISLESERFGFGQQGNILVRVKNRGEDAIFSMSLGTCTHFRETYADNTFNIAAGDTNRETLFITPGVLNKNVEERCSVCVKDVNKPTNRDCKNVDIEFIADQSCVPNKYSMDRSSNAIYKCKPDGLGKELIIDCDNIAGDYVVKDTGRGQYGGYECIRKGTDPENGNGDGEPLNWIYLIVVGFISAVLAGVVLYFTLPVRAWGKAGAIIWVIIGLVVFIASFIIIPLIVNSIVNFLTDLFSFG